MSGKQAKKLRRGIRKEIRIEYAESVRDIAEMNNRMLKPKPKFFPAWLWIKLLSIFVYIKK